MDSDNINYGIWALGLIATIIILLNGNFAITIAIVTGAITTLMSLWVSNKGRKEYVNLKTDVTITAITVPIIFLSFYAIVFWDLSAFIHTALVVFVVLLIFAIAVFGE